MTIQTSVAHDDDVAVQVFANAMCRKLAKKRADGRHGWKAMTSGDLAEMFVEQIVDGDTIDLANFAMFLGMRGKRRAEIRRALRGALFNYVALHSNVHLTTTK